MAVPLIVKVLFAHTPVTPFGNPVTVAFVAPVVLYVIFVIGKFIQAVCESVPAEELSVMVLILTLIVPVFVTTPQPPVNVMV